MIDAIDDKMMMVVMMMISMLMMTMKVMIDKLKNEYHTTYRH
jgi:hypothetical protein